MCVVMCENKFKKRSFKRQVYDISSCQGSNELSHLIRTKQYFSIVTDNLTFEEDGEGMELSDLV